MEEKPKNSPTQAKNPIEALSREELIQKYKGLLGIAKKAKQAKDELAEENRKLQESLLQCETQKVADKKALLTMRETLDQFTEQKLKLTNEFSDLQKKTKRDEEAFTNLRIENESLRRQLDRANADNESLLKDIDRMEDQLKQVNILGMEQKKHLGLLELEVNKLKEAESLNNTLQSTVYVTQEENKALKEQENSARQALEELKQKYSRVKEINTEQRHKFNGLKERFVEVHRKLKNLKECKRVLLETQHEYAEAISKWQKEIVNASNLLFNQMNILQKENEGLRQRIQNEPTFETIKPNATNFNVKTTEENLQEMQDLCRRVRGDLQEKDTLIAKAHQQNVDLQIHIDTLKKEMGREAQSSQNNKVKPLTQELEVSESRLSGGEAEKSEIRPDYNELLQRLNILEVERSCLQQRCELVEELQTEKLRLQNEVDNLLSKLKESNQVHEDLQHIRYVIKTMEQEKISLLAQIQKQECEQQHSVENIKTTAQNYAELQTRYKQMEREHADLLCEMRELNEALKGRGDVISRQQEKQQELMNELRKTNAKLKQIDDVLLQKDAAIAEKEAQVREITHEIDLTRQQTSQLKVASTQSEEQLRILNEELQTLRTNAAANAADTQSDILSTSTISRAEEIARMREVDDSFEEKYNKLRNLAMKLKKKLHEQTGQLSEMEQQQAGHESMKVEFDELRKQHNNLQQLNMEQQQIIDSLKLENQKLKTSRKQANVLNLEIEAAEKSLNEATTKLATKTNELEKMNEQLISKEHTIMQLRKEITFVESAKEAEIAHATELKEQVDLLQKQLKDAIHAKQAASDTTKLHEQTQELLKQELDQLRLEVSQCAAESAAALRLAQHEKDDAISRLTHITAELRDLQIKHTSVASALESLRAEHAEYKQKAQAVLRKHQTTDNTRERELSEELTQLRLSEEQQREAIVEQTKKLVTLEQNNADLNLDNENLQQRIKELDASLQQLRVQNDNLLLEQRNQLQAHQTTLRTQRQQMEVQQEFQKQQLLDLETKYQQQIEVLRNEKSVLPIRMPTIIGGVSAVNQPSTNVVNTAIFTEQQQTELLMLTEREDAEGSDEAPMATYNTVTAPTATTAFPVNGNQQAVRKISNSSRRSQHDFMPLDELLNAPMHAFQADTGTTLISNNSFGAHMELNEAAGNSNVEKLHVELNATREMLTKQESRIRHLTSLLAENEQDLAKLTQMNDMLKEELRRQERAVEREAHMHNAEYLKNVVLKFLTLTSGDERVRLVPVLNTILKLSRTETETLNCVAKGQKLPTESQGRGWGSFLPIFGSGSAGGNSN